MITSSGASCCTYMQVSLKVFCACERRSEKNVPAEKLNVTDGHIQIWMKSACKFLSMAFCACERRSPLARINEFCLHVVFSTKLGSRLIVKVS